MPRPAMPRPAMPRLAMPRLAARRPTRPRLIRLIRLRRRTRRRPRPRRPTTPRQVRPLTRQPHPPLRRPRPLTRQPHPPPRRPRPLRRRRRRLRRRQQLTRPRPPRLRPKPLPGSPRTARPWTRRKAAGPDMLEEALEHLVKGIVEHPDDVQVGSRGLRRGRVLEVRVHPDDLGKVIGRGGRTARALRTVIGSLAGNNYVRVDLLDADEAR